MGKPTINQHLKNMSIMLQMETLTFQAESVAYWVTQMMGLDTIMDEMADLCVKHSNPSEDFSNIGEQFKNVDFVKDRIIMVAVSREKNADLLKDVPHTNREDLALIYKVYLGNGEDGVATITIHNSHLDFWGLTVNEVHELAMKNTRELLPVTVQSMNEVMRELFSKDGMDEDMMEALLQDMPADQQMYVITNQSRLNGAASMFYEDVLSDLAEKVGTDLYILPSSVHECIAVSCKLNTPDALAEMVSEINEGQVAADEQLSDHVYHFSAETKKLALADTTVEALGLAVAENNTYDATQTTTEGNRPHNHR